MAAAEGSLNRPARGDASRCPQPGEVALDVLLTIELIKFYPWQRGSPCFLITPHRMSRSMEGPVCSKRASEKNRTPVFTEAEYPAKDEWVAPSFVLSIQTLSLSLSPACRVLEGLRETRRTARRAGGEQGWRRRRRRYRTRRPPPANPRLPAPSPTRHDQRVLPRRP